ncbi:hypothetical protein GX645_04780 [Candidatus Sumerlaeota bacterium]|nr:hypothetical protein [Candidatus Sumerlaeales bacterium]NLD61747.1 hypothetical protein [Candidatus Sumerlaeota bacterium]
MNISKFLRKGLLIGFAFVSAMACAEEYALPDRTELSSFSEEALAYYTSGVQALDCVDYYNAYNNFLKASQLQPDAMRLNLITAALAVREGRSLKALDAPEAYENAITCYHNVLRQKKLDESMRREVLNKTKLAMQEVDTLRLAQRDAKREAMGTQFITKLNQDMMSAKSLFDDNKKKTKSKSVDKTLLTRQSTGSDGKNEVAKTITQSFVSMHNQQMQMMKQQQQQGQQMDGMGMGMGMPGMGGMATPGMGPGAMPGMAAGGGAGQVNF